jgi:hypothetical protein
MFFITDVSTGDYKLSHIILALVLGASGFVYLYLLVRLAKNPTPWLRRNFGLMATIGGFLNAVVILWSMFSRK